MASICEVLPKTDAAGYPVIAALVGNRVVPLATPLLGNAVPTPLTRRDAHGWDVHRDTVVFLLAMCAKELYPEATFRVRSSLSQALWCTLEGTGKPVEECVAELKEELDKLVRRDLPIIEEPVPYEEAVNTFRAAGRTDEVNLLRHRNPPAVMVMHCDGFGALALSTLAPRTGSVQKAYDLVCYDGEIVVNVPRAEAPDTLVDIDASTQTFDVLRRQKQRTSVTGVATVGDLNACILNGKFDELVRTVEAFHTKDLSNLADAIASRNPKVRLVLLCGPSSAGKTTTAHRLCTQLRIDGLKPLALSTDDYFVGDSRNPRTPDGKFDYETVEAVDAERLAHDLNELFAGRAVRLRVFDFKAHEGYDAKEETRLEEGGVVVLEGIHALNPRLTKNVPDELKFRIYINAMTHLVLDSCNRLPTSDTRLLRRLVRDYRTRATSPLKTFELWENVLCGERRWIYPYQREADAVFNSSLDYELAVLKPLVLQLLNEVKPWDEAYVTARRLSGLLHNVSIARADAVPQDSILRESIG